MSQDLLEGNSYKQGLVLYLDIKNIATFALEELIHKINDRVLGYPKNFWCKNGSEFKSQVIKLSLKQTLKISRAINMHTHGNIHFLKHKLLSKAKENI